LYRKAYTPVDISGNFKVTLARLRARQDRGLDLDMAFLRDKLESCSRYVTAQATKVAKFELERYRKNYHTFLTSQAIMQGISRTRQGHTPRNRWTSVEKRCTVK
jgi:hypothetical protein